MPKAEPKNLATRVAEAKSFEEIVAILVAENRRQIRATRSRLRSGATRGGHREWDEQMLNYVQNALRRIERGRQRFELYQGNRKLPAATRKQLREKETWLLRCEHGFRPDRLSTVGLLRQKLTELYRRADRVLAPPEPPAAVNPAFAAGKSYPGRSVEEAYDEHVWEVLADHLAPESTFDPKSRKCRVTAPLPEPAEYAALKARFYTRPAEEQAERGYGLLAQIADRLDAELAGQEDDLEENEGDGWGGREDEAEMLGEAIRQVEDILGEAVTPPDAVSSVPVLHYPRAIGNTSERDLAAEAAALLRAVAAAVEGSPAATGRSKTAAAEAAAFAERLRLHADETEELDLP